MSSPLARIEELAESHATALIDYRDVLALVNVAKAAEDAVHYWNAEDKHSLDSAMLGVDEALAVLDKADGK